MTAMTATLTAEEFLAGDHPIGSELVDGEVYVNDPAFDHHEVAGRLYFAVTVWARAPSGGGRSGYGGNWVLADGQIYKPDVWWCVTRPRGTRHDGPPDLAVEVRSSGTWARDVGPKLREYEAAGTAELWLVDTPARTVLVFRRTGEGPGFGVAVEVGPGERLTSPLLPGFTLAVDELFADVDS